MKIDTNRLFKDLKTLRSFLLTNPSDSIFLSNLGDFQKLNTVFAALTGFDYDEAVFFSDKSRGMRVKSSNKKMISGFYNAYYENEDLFLSMIDNFDSALENMGFMSLPFMDTLKKYSEKEAIDIMLSYYSTYGDSVYKIVKKHFDENKIQNGLFHYEDFEGEYFESKYMRTGYISSSSDKFDSKSMATIVHELGHAVDREVFIFPQQKRLTLRDEIMLEVPSGFYELEFLEFLKKNHIDITGANTLLNCIYNMIRDYSLTLEEVYSCDDAGISKNGDLIIPVGDNKYEAVNLKQIVYYSVGYLFGLHLCESYEGDPRDFNKRFFNLLCSRKEKNVSESIEDFGYNIDEFTSGSIILPRVESSTLELKRRYNIKV